MTPGFVYRVAKGFAKTGPGANRSVSVLAVVVIVVCMVVMRWSWWSWWSRSRDQRLGRRELADGELVLRDVIAATLEEESHPDAPADLHHDPLVGERAAG